MPSISPTLFSRIMFNASISKLNSKIQNGLTLNIKKPSAYKKVSPTYDVA